MARNLVPIAVDSVLIDDPESWDAFDFAAKELPRFDWIGFTSARGVINTVRRLGEIGVPLSELSQRSIAAVGPATSLQLKVSVRGPDLIPDQFSGADLARAFGDVHGRRILLPRAQRATRDLPAMLRGGGATVVEAPVYQVTGKSPELLAKSLMSVIKPDILALTSGSSAEVLIPAAEIAWGKVPPIVAIGPTTARSARELGHPASKVSSVYSVVGLASAIEEFVTAHG